MGPNRKPVNWAKKEGVKRRRWRGFGDFFVPAWLPAFLTLWTKVLCSTQKRRCSNSRDACLWWICLLRSKVPSNANWSQKMRCCLHLVGNHWESDWFQAVQNLNPSRASSWESHPSSCWDSSQPQHRSWPMLRKTISTRITQFEPSSNGRVFFGDWAKLEPMGQDESSRVVLRQLP